MSSPNEGEAQPTRGGASTQVAQAGWGLPLMVLIIGMFMSVLDTTIVGVAVADHPDASSAGPPTRCSGWPPAYTLTPRASWCR